MWEKHQLVASHTYPNWGSNLQPRYMPWPGIQPCTFWCGGDTPTTWARLAGAGSVLCVSEGAERGGQWQIHGFLEDHICSFENRQQKKGDQGVGEIQALNGIQKPPLYTQNAFPFNRAVNSRDWWDFQGMKYISGNTYRGREKPKRRCHQVDRHKWHLQN